MKLLGISTDAKTVKGEKMGVLTGILYMAPADASGVANVCKYATDGCRAACLFTAGRAAAFPMINEARIRKTKLFYADRAEFFRLLIADIGALVRKAKRENLTPAVRLNGTSDLPWERVKVVRDSVAYANIMALFPVVQFYDYTKSPMAARPVTPSNYDLTYSHSGAPERDAETDVSLVQGRRVAMVFDTKKGAALPAEWRGVPVIDGDVSDVRFADPIGVIVGLRAKGDAIGDTSGFVVRA